MSYIRVIPRDLFNEANFLKCLGQLSLLINDGLAPEGLSIQHQRPETGFEITIDAGSGDLIMSNMFLVSQNGCRAWLHRPLNSRDSWPLYIVDWDEDEEIFVFAADGSLSKEFVDWATSKK